ncbi:hypothetical protein K491DRAFT_719353 [Lophiostoma macrostomum CBS 122681]|uniref:Uncharacterized protein n=1 Tax=Lophiostoma macrostomum CBS 122681 TaxID=1314788 RepID=A0A6A6SWJ6_9PLEO|nr:hypothetical protein K491DRAFT_719353 [Lophiostoma macrostomum CBS 122681]
MSSSPIPLDDFFAANDYGLTESFLCVPDPEEQAAHQEEELECIQEDNNVEGGKEGDTQRRSLRDGYEEEELGSIQEDVDVEEGKEDDDVKEGKGDGYEEEELGSTREDEAPVQPEHHPHKRPRIEKQQPTIPSQALRFPLVHSTIMNPTSPVLMAAEKVFALHIGGVVLCAIYWLDFISLLDYCNHEYAKQWTLDSIQEQFLVCIWTFTGRNNLKQHFLFRHVALSLTRRFPTIYAQMVQFFNTLEQIYKAALNAEHVDWKARCLDYEFFAANEYGLHEPLRPDPALPTPTRAPKDDGVEVRALDEFFAVNDYGLHEPLHPDPALPTPTRAPEDDGAHV